MIRIDGSRYSGSGTIVRQSVALAALTGQAVHVVNARSRRPKPGLRPQHVRVIEAIRDLKAGLTEGVEVGSTEFTFTPGRGRQESHLRWDIGSAGSTTLLASALLPVLAFWPTPVSVELQGGLFQDFAPSFYHFRYALLPVLEAMGLKAMVEMGRPGYVPRGGGVLRMAVTPVASALRPLVVVGDHPRPIGKIWGIALASHLAESNVSGRMADAATRVLVEAGHRARIELRDEETAFQPGAALALFVDLEGGGRIGSDQAGARGRRPVPGGRGDTLRSAGRRRE